MIEKRLLKSRTQQPITLHGLFDPGNYEFNM